MIVLGAIFIPTCVSFTVATAAGAAAVSRQGTCWGPGDYSG